MTFKFITTPKSLKKVIVYSKGLDDVAGVIHSDKATECLNVNLKEIPTNARNIPISLELYLHDLDVYTFDDGDDRIFIASMYQNMLQCYAYLCTCQGVEVTEIYDDFRTKYQSEIKIHNIIHPAGKDRKKWLDKCVDKAVTNSKASVLGDAIDIDYDEDGLTITVHMQSTPFTKDSTTARQIGVFINELMLLLEQDVNRKTVICCSKCFKELMRVTIPIKYTRKYPSSFHIENDLCEVKCCEGGEWIDIDQELYPTIKYMNENGLKTIFCCASHPYTDNDMYIAFDNKCIPVETMGVLLNTMMTSDPILTTAVKKWFDFENYPYESHHIIRAKRNEYITHSREVGFEKAREDLIQLLHEFCVQLVDYYKAYKRTEVTTNELCDHAMPEQLPDQD